MLDACVFSHVDAACLPPLRRLAQRHHRSRTSEHRKVRDAPRGEFADNPIPLSPRLAHRSEHAPASGGAYQRPSRRRAERDGYLCPHPRFAAVLELCPCADRGPERRVFEGFGGDRFRTAITRACTAAGVPTFRGTTSAIGESRCSIWPAFLGPDRRARRTAEPRSHREYLHPRHGRGGRARLRESLGRDRVVSPWWPPGDENRPLCRRVRSLHGPWSPAQPSGNRIVVAVGLMRPHTWDLSTANSQPGEDGSKPCSISQRAACRLRNDHHARITPRSTSVP
jgi:hypothetical protein